MRQSKYTPSDEDEEAMLDLKAHRRAESLKYKYNLTPEQYDLMRQAQGNRCAICGGKPGRPEGLYVDHDHETGHVRGLLCSACNIGLGHFRDDVLSLAAAIKYLNGTRQ